MRLVRSIGHGVAMSLCGIAGAGDSAAASSDAVRTENSEAQLVAERAAVPGEIARVGLRLEHRPEWHSYWRNPGDSGLATEISWTLPEGWDAGGLEWPAPDPATVGPVANYGTEGESVFARARHRHDGPPARRAARSPPQ